MPSFPLPFLTAVDLVDVFAGVCLLSDGLPPLLCSGHGVNEVLGVVFGLTVGFGVAFTATLVVTAGFLATDGLLVTVAGFLVVGLFAACDLTVVLGLGRVVVFGFGRDVVLGLTVVLGLGRTVVLGLAVVFGRKVVLGRTEVLGRAVVLGRTVVLGRAVDFCWTEAGLTGALVVAGRLAPTVATWDAEAGLGLTVVFGIGRFVVLAPAGFGVVFVCTGLALAGLLGLAAGFFSEGFWDVF